MDEWNKIGSITKESKEAWVQNFFLLESFLRNWNEGKAITDIVLNETCSNGEFYYPAIWHAKHLIFTLKQYPRPLTPL